LFILISRDQFNQQIYSWFLTTASRISLGKICIFKDEALISS